MVYSNNTTNTATWTERLRKNSLIIIATFAVIGWFSAKDLHLMLRSHYWLSTQGVIVQSSVNRGLRGGPDSPFVEFRYQVNGRVYLSNMIDFGQWSYDVSEYLNKYPVGKIVTIYYDSVEPKYAVLEKSGNVFANVMLVIIFWGGAGALAYYRFKVR